MQVDFSRFEAFGDAPALVDEAGRSTSYRELVALCREFLKGLGEQRELILLEAGNDRASVIAYVALTTAGHPVILVGADAGDGHRRIVEPFRPTFLCRGGRLQRLGDEPAPQMHPDLSVLLPTSGSTGSPKLVRLSRRNLEANAASIVEYLQIGSEDRAITSLPLYYSFGLSVLNSHLSAGASLVLTEMSATNPEFWTLFRAQGATSIAGVPYSYELFERIGLRDDPPPTLRTMTQAGGRLAPELVKAYAQFGAARGVRFYTMYGQTEASPRMAYLPPEAAAANPDCVGVPIPGGAFRLIDENGVEITRPESSGELVYRGPNVMMGYAFDRADLAKGAEHDELRTGDLAVRTAKGLYRIVGRASRFVKIAGLRIGLDDVETLLKDAGITGYASGTDGRVAICAVGADAEQARDYIARRCGLPAAAVTAYRADAEPRLASGKVDYRTILTTCEKLAAAELAKVDQGGVIAAAYAKALGIGLPPPEASFASLGGDSLSYVNASIGVEKALGQLPPGWETMPIARLEAMAPATPVAPSRLSWISSEMVVRIAALTLVAIGHAAPDQTLWLRGGSNVLFALAGYSLARFQRESLLQGRIWPAIGGSLYRVILPYYLIMVPLVAVSQAEKSWGWPLLVSDFTVKVRGPLFAYWFIESVFHALVIACLLFLIPPVRKFAAARPFASAMAFVAAAVALKYALPPLWNDGRDIHLTVDAWIYTYFIGWAAYMAREAWQKWVVVALAVVLAGLDYGIPNSREMWLTVALLVVLFLPRVKLPTVFNKAVLTLASASYFIYLMHVFVVHVVTHVLHQSAPPITIPAILIPSALLGLAYAMAWGFAAPRVVDAGRRLLQVARKASAEG